MKTPRSSAEGQTPRPPESAAEREARRAAALRANLARRKAQARGRADADGADPGDGAGG